MITIRPLNNKDPLLAEILLALSIDSYSVEAEITGITDFPPLQETVYDLLSNQNLFIGFWEGSALLGALEYSTDGKETWIHRLVVKPGHFKKGIASQLLSSLMNDSSKHFVGTSPLNIPAVRLYGKFGFQYAYEKMVGKRQNIRWAVYQRIY